MIKRTLVPDTVARQNRWNVKRLAKEWEQRRTRVLEAEHSNSLATTTELSLTSSLFRRVASGNCGKSDITYSTYTSSAEAYNGL